MCIHFKTHSVAFEFCKNFISIYKSSLILPRIFYHSIALLVNEILFFLLRSKLSEYFFTDMKFFFYDLKYLVSILFLTGLGLLSLLLSLFFWLWLSFWLLFELVIGLFGFCDYKISFCKFNAFFINFPKLLFVYISTCLLYILYGMSSGFTFSYFSNNENLSSAALDVSKLTFWFEKLTPFSSYLTINLGRLNTSFKIIELKFFY